MTDLQRVKEMVTSVYDGDVIYDLPAPRATRDSAERCRGYCAENICGNYGISCTCPPNSDPVDTCIERLDSYGRAMLIIRRYRFDLSDRDGLGRAMVEVQSICRDIHLSLSRCGVRNLPLANGPCAYCAECPGTGGGECTNPEFKVGSVSPYGIMINEYLESVGIEPEPVGDTIALYGFILYD